MRIHVSKDADATIDAAVRSGQFASAEEMIERLVREYASHVQARTGPAREVPAEWAVRLQAWVDAHPSRSVDIDDSRESIYGERVG